MPRAQAGAVAGGMGRCVLDPGKTQQGSRRHALGKASLSVGQAVSYKGVRNTAWFEYMQELAGFVWEKNEAAASQRVTFTLERWEEGKASVAAAGTWPVIVCPHQDGDNRPGAHRSHSPALLGCVRIPAVQPLSFDVTPPAIAMAIEHRSITGSWWAGTGPSRGQEEGRLQGQHG